MSQFNTFIASHVRVGAELSVASAKVGIRWGEFNNSTTGKVLLFKHLLTLEGVTKHNGKFQGMELIDKNVKPDKETIIQPIIETTKETIEFKPTTFAEFMELERLKQDSERLKQDSERLKQDTTNFNKNLEATKEMKYKEIEATKEMKYKELETAKQLQTERLMHEKEENTRKFAFMSIENNKNRMMFDRTNEHYHDILDLQAWGTSSVQYITAESIAKNIGANIGIHDCYLGMNTKETRKESLKQIMNVAVQTTKKFMSPVPLETKLGVSTATNCIDINTVPNIVSDIVQTCKDDGLLIDSDEHWKDVLVEKCKNIKLISKSNSFNKTYPTHFETIKQLTKCSLQNLRDKKKYCKTRNQRRIKQNKDYINCYTCHREIEMDTKDTQRCHNVPDSKNGSAHEHNIYLACSSCNQVMGTMLLESYALVKILEETPEWMECVALLKEIPIDDCEPQKN